MTNQHLLKEEFTKKYTEDDQYRQLKIILISVVAVLAVAVSVCVWLGFSGVFS